MHTEMDDWLIVDDFGIYIQEDPDGWETINHIAGNTFVINGLTPETIYEWQVQGVSPECPDGVTDWSRNPRFATTTASHYQLDIVGHGGNEGRWYLIALPVQETTAPTSVVNLIAQPAENYDLYRFNQSAEMEWENYKQEGDHYLFDLENGQGYLYANANDVTLAFTGTPYYNGTQPGDVTITLRKDDDAQWAGWNLIGNPFGTNATLDMPSYKMNNDGTALEAQVENSTVECMEGVFVKATGTSQTATFTVPTRGSEKSTVAMLNVLLGKVPEPVEGPTQNNGVSTSSTTLTLDNAIVRFDGGQTLEKFSFREGSTKLYIPQDGKEYAIANANAQSELPLNFEAAEDGTYTLTVDTKGLEMEYLHLIDNLTGADIDLLPLYKGGRGDSQPATYTFQAKTTDYASRFKLVFATKDGPSTSSGTFAYYNGSEWMINNTGEATLQVVDVLGHVLHSETINGNATFSANGLSAGVYVMRLVAGEYVKTQKIVVR